MNQQTPRSSDSLKGHFLIATPMLSEGFFARTVGYICEHGDTGAMAIVINQAVDVELPEILEHLDIGAKNIDVANTTVLAGGPVQVEHGFILHRPQGHWDTTLDVAHDLWLTTSLDILHAIAAGGGPSDYLVALGYAGWGPGQLEEELAQGSWLTVAADADVLFATEVENRLDAAASLLGIDIHLMSSDTGHA